MSFGALEFLAHDAYPVGTVVGDRQPCAKSRQPGKHPQTTADQTGDRGADPDRRQLGVQLRIAVVELFLFDPRILCTGGAQVLDDLGRSLLLAGISGTAFDRCECLDDLTHRGQFGRQCGDRSHSSSLSHSG